MKIKRFIINFFIYVFLVIISCIALIPLLMALINSFKTNRELLINVMSLPENFSLENYLRTVKKMYYPRSFTNTTILATFSVFFIVIFSSLAGWRLCRTKTKLSGFLLKLFIFSMLIPFSSIMIPLYRVSLLFNIKNSLIGLSFIYAGLGVSMAIFLYHGFVKGIPIEMEEAAAIDGGNPLQIFFKIVLPMLKPITATIIITNVLWIWNDFLLPLIIISDNKKYTLLLSTNTLFGQYGSDWTAILGALILAALPVIVFYSVFQKQILKGITDGAIKG